MAKQQPAPEEEPSTAVVPAQTTAVATADGWDDFNWSEPMAGGIRPTFPEIRLVQKATPTMPGSAQHLGDFFFPDTSDFTPTFDGVIVMYDQTRALFDEDHPGGPVCSSSNGLTPRSGGSVWSSMKIRLKNQATAQEVPHGQPRTCATCIFSQWSDDPQGKRQPAPCRESFLALVEEADSGDLYRFRFKGMSLPLFRTWANQLASKGVRRRRAQPRPPFSARLRFISELKEAKEFNSNFYVARVETIETTPPELAPEYAELYHALRREFEAVAVDTEYEEPDAAAPADDGWIEGDDGWNAQMDKLNKTVDGEVVHEKEEPAKGQAKFIDPDDLPFE